MLTDTERRECIQALANHPVLEVASAESTERIISAAQLRKVEKGTLLIREGDVPRSVCFVLKGVTRIFHSVPDGREFTPKMLAAPSHFGDVELLSAYPRNFQSVETLSEALVAFVDWEVVKSVLQSDHQVSLAWLSGIAAQFVQTIDADRHHVFVGLEGRLANYLLSVGEILGERRKTGLRISLPLSREELARQVGSVKRSVLRVIQSLTRRGLLEEDGQALVIRSDEALLREMTLPGRLGLSHATQAERLRALLGPGPAVS